MEALAARDEVRVLAELELRRAPHEGAVERVGGGGWEVAGVRVGCIAGGGQAGLAEGGLDEVSGQGAEGSGAGGVEGQQQRLQDHVLLLRVGAGVAVHEDVVEVALGESTGAGGGRVNVWEGVFGTKPR